MTSFICYIYNAMIKFQQYFTSHMCIARKSMDIIPFHDFMHLYRSVMHINIKMLVLFLYISIFIQKKN